MSAGRASALLLCGVLAAGGPSRADAQMALATRSLRPTASWLDTAYVEAVIQLDVENGPSAVLPALTYSSTLMLPLRRFLDMVEVRVQSFVLRDSVVVILEPGHVPLRIKPSARVLQVGGTAMAYDTMDVVWWDGDLFVSTRVLDRLLALRTVVEWSNLSATVGRTGGLPVVQRRRREHRREQLGQSVPVMGVLDMPLRERTIDGTVLTWSLTAAKIGPADQHSLDLGIGAGLFGGSAELRPQFYDNVGGSGGMLQASWTRVWSQSRWLRQLKLGDVASNGRVSRLMEGVTITNAPFVRSSEFDVEQFAGKIAPGWEVELYDAGRLTAYVDADAMGSFRVPLQLGYGQNPFELVMYGPGGETIRQKRTIRVPFSRIPRGRFEYALAVGHCRYDPCDGIVSADTRFGLSSIVTLQGGWDAFIGGTRGSLFQPYAVVSASPLPALGLTGEAVINGHLRAVAEYEPTPDLRLSTGYTRFSQAEALPGQTLTETGRAEATAFWRPGWLAGQLFIQGTGVLSTGPSDRRNLERLSFTTRFGKLRYTLGVLSDAYTRVSAPTTHTLAIDASVDAFLMGPWAWLRSSNVTGQLAFDPSVGLTALRTSAGRRISHLFRLDAGIGWFRTSGLTFELSLSSTLPGPRATARSRISAQPGASEALMYSSGSVAWNPRTQLLRLGDGGDLGRAGLTGQLFRDDNGNGVRDPGEPGIPGIPVIVGGWPAETDADGRFSAWGLFPFEPVQIQVDSLSFADPHYLLPAPMLRVRPAPNSFGTVEIPVVVGGEVGGYVIFKDQPLGGVPVLLRELNTGAEITILTYVDGAFYKAAVPPGEYEVTLPEPVLARLNAVAPPLSIFIPPGNGEKHYEDLQLRLEPRP